MNINNFLDSKKNILNYFNKGKYEKVTKLGKKFLKAAIHPYDKTCRPQIINKNQNKSYENLIKQFGDISGVYGLLNTSFNLHGYPIVNEFDEVSSVFINSNLDGLLLDDCLIVKK